MLSPAAFNTKLDVRALQLNQLFPTVETTKTGLGKISGQFDLKGRGNSVAQMLGSASGDVAVLMGKGEISNILLEFMGLDGGEVIKFLLRGDRNVQLRCAAAAFDVKQGLMSSRAIVLDTSDTLITGEGQISLANETLDIVLKPQPKDVSILSLRSPLRIGGTFADMTAGPEKTALAGRAGLALLLGAINPLLALAATIETGPGEDADCADVLTQAAQAKSSPSQLPAKNDSGDAADSSGTARRPVVPVRACRRPCRRLLRDSFISCHSMPRPSSISSRPVSGCPMPHSSLRASAACTVPTMPTSGANTPMVAQRVSSKLV